MEFQDGVASLSRQQKIKFELSSIDGGYPLPVKMKSEKLKIKN